ncbi:hypothetical protein E2C01_064849 [Portunus trituberculatus]|uniref:Uncharacterized protein n=1 Tax=Portunus trituberculatus TaxID=210409 RepID=A0A5B7HLX8_PORTR|nr:hypothetical protein [Portunus trituberculatus]
MKVWREVAGALAGCSSGKTRNQLEEMVCCLGKGGAKASSKASWYRSLMVGGAKASSKPHGTEASWYRRCKI